jgi:hypothetical protein
MTQPDALIRDGLLASRIDLQFKEIGDKQIVFLEAASKFNDKTFKSGGLVGEHWMFKDSAVNPENFCENSKPAGRSGTQAWTTADACSQQKTIPTWSQPSK